MQNHSSKAMNWENKIISNKYGAGVAPSRTYTLSQGIALWGFLIRSPKMALRMGILQAETRKAAEDASEEEVGKCISAEVAGEGEE